MHRLWKMTTHTHMKTRIPISNSLLLALILAAAETAQAAPPVVTNASLQAVNKHPSSRTMIVLEKW